MKQQQQTGYLYNTEINLNEGDEIKYWKTRLNISAQQLVGAVKATKSNKVSEIEEYLLNRKLRPRRPRFIAQI